MKAVRLLAPRQMDVAEVPVPDQIGPDEVLVRVEATGLAVQGLRAGDRVALDPAISCGRCEACRLGHHHVCPDGRFVMAFRAAPPRRKGLTIKVARRMNHVYPRTLALLERGMVNLDALVSHRLPLEQAPEGFRMLADYADDALKVVIVN